MDINNLDNENFGHFYSWDIINKKIAIKTADKSFFEHNGSGIPRENRWFWNIDKLNAGGRKDIVLIRNDVKYDARIEKDTKYDRTRLFWKAYLSKELNKYNINKSIYPLIKFERQDEDVYIVSVLETLNIELCQIENDVLAESEDDQEVQYDGGNKEGKQKAYYTTRYERNPKNRAECLKINSVKCSVCDFDFESIYGKYGKNYIEVHHIKPLYSLEEEVEINPKTDLIPVCSNCHRIIHRKRDRVLTIEEMREIIKK